MLASIIASICFVLSMSFYFVYRGSLFDFGSLLVAFCYFSIPVFIVIGAPAAFLLDKVTAKLADRLIMRLAVSYILYLLAGAALAWFYNLYLNFLTSLVVKLGLVASTIYFVTITIMSYVTLLKRKKKVLD
ncbi:hypothetical protein ACFQ88_34045 [Paenibacillus sp. NPDC056579]|uniref:hypothetical protein n=1 Tax=Paenibacillus sp. NPDC056579 TaxID=3345871 RepID=UPI00368A850B